MRGEVSARLAEVLVGLMVAGVLMAILVPALGPAAGRWLAAGVAVVSVAGVMLVARAIRGPARPRRE